MRTWLLAGLTAVVIGVVTIVCVPALLKARSPAAGDEPAARAAQLPIGQVVLFSSGVGYFQREGTVEGDARVDLSFPVGDVNDLIKSMVLRDLDGGHIAAVSYDSNAPIDRTLKSFAVNLTGNPSFADILHQARGEKAEVALANAGAGTLSGTIVGVEKQPQAVGKEVVEQAVLTLWCADGMRGVKLADVQRVRFLNATLDSEFRKALETLALSHDTQKKAVSIRFVGDGKRRVKVGYVIENPVWKTSYRLVLSPKGEDKPYLQGWAVVENPTDEDWKDVRMALVSGRPISFQMDLYQPLYVPRPVVVPELFQGLRPVAYEGKMDSEVAFTPPGRPTGGGAGFGKARLARESGGKRDEAKKESEEMDLRAGVSALSDGAYAREVAKQLGGQMQLGQTVSAAATAAKLGDFFQYALDRPVSLPRQKSALLPIVGKDVEAARVSIYNERVQAKFPLLGLKFKNSSGTHLMQGPITVFEGSNYAGDAQIRDIQPNEERLLSYAIDLGMEVAPAPATSNGRITQLKVVKGILTSTTKVVESRVYTAKNRNDQERTLLIEHPVRPQFTLVDCKPAETTADLYRFELKLPAGQTKAQTVSEEHVLASSIAIVSHGDEQLRWFMAQPVMSKAVKDGLAKAMELRVALGRTTAEVGEQQKQLNVIVQDQGRLRANLKEMPSTAAAYKRYLEKFDRQETEIEKYQADIKALEAKQHSQQKAFDDFLVNFTAE